MRNMRTAGASIALTGSLLLTGGALAGPASAANQIQDGLVNVAVGDITVQNIKVGVAANIIATVCGLKVGPINALGRQVDRSGVAQTINCPNTGGTATVSNNN
ncbi:hypothetical protein [Arthrobacter globiformis]|uniref:hypothetical protein n=1 Tax=Arthrobacter globiformis TaxID=1665 RepID=UPI00397D8B02